MALEIARRWSNGRWQNSVAEEESGGSQALQLLGPFTATGDMAGIDTVGVALAPLVEGTILLHGFIVVTEQFDGNTINVNLGVGASLGDWQNIASSQNTIVGSPTGAVLFNRYTISTGQLALIGARMTSDGVLVANLFTAEPPVTEGSADFYALAYVPS